ncbi:odorant receptor Or2-like [Anopheles maculipalpis]|uniref:odorant receptor Or2-like n=1 Tax=Anopheles maculipalpis TaxID=1496333 RepID=UPI00215925EC|nr:odorant receptor Or2-like [Anopheles maculipalpis]
MEHIYRWIVRNDKFTEEVFLKCNFCKLSTLGIYKDSSKAPLGSRVAFYAMELFFLLQIGTIVWDLATVLNDIGLFGDNMCILAGLLLTMVKKWHCVRNMQELSECIEQFQAYHEHYLKQGERFVRRMRRQDLQERLLQDASTLLAMVLATCLLVNALFSNGQTLILRATYPFSTSTPLGYGCVFLCQAILVVYVLFTIVQIDCTGAQILSQMSLLFCMQRMEFEMIGADLALPTEGSLYGDWQLRQSVHKLIASHQQLLAFCDRLKRLYEPNIMAQFVCSMLIICLTAFELMFAKGDPMQMMRFGAYMLTAFYQIFVWSFFGNRVTNMSTGISDATIGCNWIVLDDGLKKDLRFTTMRSQKPFIIDVYWLFPLTYETFIAILSRSYSIFTLLRTMIE